MGSVRISDCHLAKGETGSSPVHTAKSNSVMSCFFCCNATFFPRISMPYFVYILQSEKDHSYYKGFTENISKRLFEHNNGFSRYTSKKMPWKLVYLQEFETKREALIREKQIKRFNSVYLEKLIQSYKHGLG